MSRFRPVRALATTLVASLVVTLPALAALAPPAQSDPVPITVTVTPSQTSVPSGSSLTYQIHVENTGGARVDDVVLTSQINGMTGLILTSTVGSCGQSNNLVTCDAGSLEGFETWDVTIRGTVNAADGTTLNNGATVAATHASNTLSVTQYTNVLVTNAVTEPRPDLTVSVQGPTEVGDGEAATFNLTVNNQGNANAVDVRVVNTLPLGFTFNAVTANSLFVCSNTPAGSRTVVCTEGRVNQGANATIQIDATAGFGDDPIENTAVVDPFDEIDELNELNNTGHLTAQGTPPPPQEGLTISKTDAPDPVRPGQTLSYDITVQNIGDRRADSVAVVDTTQGLDAASIVATTTHGECSVKAPEVVCTRTKPTLRLDVGEVMEVHIEGVVVNSAGSLITNTATVSGNIKNTGYTNTALTTTTVNPGVDLSVVQHAVVNHNDNIGDGLPDTFRAWDNYDYEISVGNSGIDDATDVRVRERLPEGVTLKSFVAPAGVSCTQAPDTRIVTCTGLDVAGSLSSGLPGGTVEKITLTVIAPPDTGTVEAVVTVDPTNAIFESDETNNSWTALAQIETGIDLTVEKDSEPKVAPSGTLIYTITVSNIGTQDSSGVLVRDLLPAGTRFREVVGDHNLTCSHNGADTGGVVECTGGILRGTHDHTLAPDEATITITLFAPTQPGFIKNQVRVDPDGQIEEILEDNNINTRMTEIVIDGGCCVYHEFTIDKEQVSPAGEVAPSGIVEYDLVVTNHGSDVAFDVTVSDDLPSGMTFRSADDTLPGTGAFTCELTGSKVLCTGGTLDGSTGQTAQPGDTTRTIHISAFAPEQPGDYVNQATIDPGNTHPEADETNNFDNVTTTVALGGGGSYIDLTVDSRQTAPTDGGGNPIDVVPNGTLQYTLDVRNVGTAVAFDVAVRDTLPEGSVFRSARDTASGEGAFTCSHAGGVVTCTGGTLDGSNNDTPAAGDDVRHIVIDVFAPSQPGTYVNQAYVDPAEAIAENDETNNSDQTATDVRLTGGGNYTDLVVDSVTADDTTLYPGQQYAYDVTVKNTGTDPAYNVVLRNTLDPGVTFVKVTAGNDFDCTHSDGVVTCDGGVLDGSNDLDPTHSDTAVVTITVKAPQAKDYTYPMQSRIDPGNTTPEANEANNTGSVDVTVDPQLNLTLTNLSSTGSQGSEGSVTWTANASGDPAVTDVYLEVNVAIGMIPLNMTTVPAGWSCQVEEDPINKVTCHGPMHNNSLNFSLKTYVTGEEKTSNGMIDPGHAFLETNESDNAASG